MIQLNISFLQEKDNHLCVILDKHGYIKEFTFKIDQYIVSNLLKEKLAKDTMNDSLLESHYFFEFLMQHNLERVHLNYIQFKHDEKSYEWLFANEEFFDQCWFDTNVYGEEFGMMSDFDFYAAKFEHDKNNDDWKV